MDADAWDACDACVGECKHEREHEHKHERACVDAPWRLLIDGPQEAAWNMAVDEAILIEHGRGQVPPTVRFYFWQVPTLSLGYFQDLAKEIDLEACAANGVAVVRRPTGGRAVLHNKEVTYAIVASRSYGAAGTVLASYQWISGGLARGLELLGLEVRSHKPVEGVTDGDIAERLRGSAACFDSPSWYEITVGGKKIIGSAQVRRDEALLQHGSILLETQSRELFALLRFEREEVRERSRRIFEGRATGIREALAMAERSSEELAQQQQQQQEQPPQIEPATVIDAMIAGFAQTLGLDLQRGSLTENERLLAEQLMLEKYGNPAWNKERGKRS